METETSVIGTLVHLFEMSEDNLSPSRQNISQHTQLGFQEGVPHRDYEKCKPHVWLFSQQSKIKYTRTDIFSSLPKVRTWMVALTMCVEDWLVNNGDCLRSLRNKKCTWNV